MPTEGILKKSTNCLNCSNLFVQYDTRAKYCSRSCAATHTQRGRPSNNRKLASRDEAAPTCACGAKLTSFAKNRSTCRTCVEKRREQKRVASAEKLADAQVQKAQRVRVVSAHNSRPDRYVKDKRRTYQRAYYRRRRQLLVDRLGGHCVDCPSSDQLEFDHVDSSTKAFAVCAGIMSKPWSLVVAEADKCVLRCRSCHMKRTLSLGQTRTCVGKTPASAKLSCNQVQAVRSLARGVLTTRNVAALLGVSVSTVKLVRSGKTYRAVT